MSVPIAIDVKGLGKAYDGVKAIDNLSLSIYQGEIFGLLGPNGAGKSTTLRILITTLKPASGTATIFGRDG
jgi:ABC-type multidrug transport system ATPase subunit